MKKIKEKILRDNSKQNVFFWNLSWQLLCSQSLKNSSNSNTTAPLSNLFQPLATLTVNKAFPNALRSLLISPRNSGCFHGIVEFYIYDALKLYVWFLKASRQLVLFHIYQCWWFSSKIVFICQKYFTDICSQWNYLLCIFLKQLFDTSTLNQGGEWGGAVCSHIDKINNIKIILERFTLSVTQPIVSYIFLQWLSWYQLSVQCWVNGLAKYSKLSDLADQRAPKPDVHSGVQRSSTYTYCTMRKTIEIKFFSCTVDTKHTAWAGRGHTFFYAVAKLNVQNVLFILKKKSNNCHYSIT